MFQMGRLGFRRFLNDILNLFSLKTINKFKNNKTRIFVLDDLYNFKEVK
jgi:hypothetical protein